MNEAYRLQVIYDYVRYCIETKDARVTTFHHKFLPYSRKQSTIDLINRAEKNQIIFAPRTFCFQDAEANLLEYKNIPLIDLYEEKKKDPGIQMITALSGAFSLIYFRKGGTNLKYIACLTPSFPTSISFEKIDIGNYAAGKISEMTPPKTWDKLDWEIYNHRRNLLASSVKIGEKLGVTFQTVLTRFKRILGDCQIWLPFFPKGYDNYVPYILTLKTDYEIGILAELKKLNRSTYVYKFDDTLVLTLFFDKHLEIDSFLVLEKKGLVHDLRVSYPHRYSNRLW